MGKVNNPSIKTLTGWWEELQQSQFPHLVHQSVASVMSEMMLSLSQFTIMTE
jgi:hypothetical protein